MASVSTAVLPAQQSSLLNKDSTKENSTQSATDIVTVFHDPHNFNVKHPLMNKWTLWFTKPPSKKENESWADLLKEVITFSSVEEFWGIYNNFPLVSTLPLKADCHLFKVGVRPEWEDSNNKNGGKWSHQVVPRQEESDIDQMWLHVLLAMIGETLEGPGDDEVRGVVFSVRKSLCRISLWTGSSGKGERKGLLVNVGQNFKSALGVRDDIPVGFTSHTSNARTKSAPYFTV